MQDLRPTHQADDLMLLLPWHAAGTLMPAQASRIDAALAADRRLTDVYHAVRRERDDVIAHNDGLGAPSPRTLLALFAAIDAEPGPSKILLRGF